MSFQITIGAWILPAILTVSLLAWAIPLREDEKPKGGMFDGLGALGAVFRTGGATIVSLIAWLIWALLR